jgi:hypothetical protein
MRIRTISAIVAAAAVPTTLAATLLSATAAPAAAQAATVTAAKVTTCTSNTLTGTIKGDLDVPAGANCQLLGVEVTGNVTVEGNLQTASTVFDKNIVVTGGVLWFINGPSHVKGSVWVLGSPGDGSNISLGDNADEYAFSASGSNDTVIDGNLTYVDNSGAFYDQSDSPLSVHDFIYELNTHQLNMGALIVNGQEAVNGASFTVGS